MNLFMEKSVVRNACIMIMLGEHPIEMLENVHVVMIGFLERRVVKNA
jgi:hypothetical protein